MSIDLFAPGAYARAVGGNLERPLDHRPVVDWMAYSINPDNGAGGDPTAWRKARTMWEAVGIATFPWLHCRSIPDVIRLCQQGQRDDSPAIGLNIEDVVRDGLDLQEVAECVQDFWLGPTNGRPVHMATLPWVQNGQGWRWLAFVVAALEIMPDEQRGVFPNGYDPAIVEDCIDHAFAEGLERVTLMFKTKAPHTRELFGEEFRYCHSLYTADDITPSRDGWLAWRGVVSPCQRPEKEEPVPPTPEKPWYSKPYPKGPPVGPAELPRRLYPQDAAEKGKTPSPPGPDVLAFKRAMIRGQRWDREMDEIDDVYYNRFAHGEGQGQVASSGIAGFQRQEGIEDTGWIGDATYQALRRALVPIGPNKNGPLLDPKAVALLREAELEVGQSNKMLVFYEWLDWFVRREPQVLYSQARPIQPLVAKERPPNLPSALDCSGSLIYISWLAELPSPDPNGYSGVGNTDSLKQAGTRVDPGRARSLAKGQRVFAFYENPAHVTAVVPGGGVWSHGRESGPEYRREGIFYRSGFSECRAYPS